MVGPVRQAIRTDFCVFYNELPGRSLSSQVLQLGTLGHALARQVIDPHHEAFHSPRPPRNRSLALGAQPIVDKRAQLLQQPCALAFELQKIQPERTPFP